MTYLVAHFSHVDLRERSCIEYQSWSCQGVFEKIFEVRVFLSSALHTKPFGVFFTFE